MKTELNNNLKDEYELQSYFVQRIEKFLNSKGRAIIGWDEILEGGLAPNATVMSWRGEKGGIAAAQQKHILGAEACVWTEYMATPAKVEYMTLPRLFAFSEIAWTPLERKNYTNFFQERIPQHLAKLDKTDVLYFVPAAIGAEDEKTYHIKGGKDVTISLKPTVLDAKIYYTFNNLSPRESDYLYENPIVVHVPDGEKRVLKTIVITPSGKRSSVTRTLFINASPSALRK